jgi:ElaB/YqjD/DUF883 family membrane-anchored ribosome-binding protein
MATRTTHNNGARKRKSSTSTFGGVIDGAEALVAATADISEDKLVDIRKTLEADLDAAREHLEELEGRIKERATSVDEYVHENPWQAVGVAAGAGLVLGALMGAAAFRR